MSFFTVGIPDLRALLRNHPGADYMTLSVVVLDQKRGLDSEEHIMKVLLTPQHIRSLFQVLD